MQRSPLLRVLGISLLALAVAGGAVAAVHEARYLITLKRGGKARDFTAVAAASLSASDRHLTVLLPADAAAQLAQLPGVDFIGDLTPQRTGRTRADSPPAARWLARLTTSVHRMGSPSTGQTLCRDCNLETAVRIPATLESLLH